MKTNKEYDLFIYRDTLIGFNSDEYPAYAIIYPDGAITVRQTDNSSKQIMATTIANLNS